MPILTFPDIEYKPSYIEAIKEYQANGEELDIDISERERNFDAFLDELKKKQEVPKEGRVPEFQFWCIDNGEYVGRINYRPHLNEKLAHKGGAGNIGYKVRPSARGKGYATFMLKEVIKIAKKDGLSELLLRCDDDNLASIKVIEKVGGKLIDTGKNQTGKLFRTYSIKLD